MNDVLLDAFRHHTWATKQLLSLCKGLPEDRLAAAGPASYGSILETLAHIVDSDGGYLRRLAGSAPEWALARREARDLDEVERRLDELGPAWERFATGEVDPERLHLLDEGTYEVHAGVTIAQVLHHGNAHREQICAILTGLGIEPPDIQPWAYAPAVGRARILPAKE